MSKHLAKELLGNLLIQCLLGFELSLNADSFLGSTLLGSFKLSFTEEPSRGLTASNKSL